MKTLRIFGTFIGFFILTTLATVVYAQTYIHPLEVNVDLTVDSIFVLDDGSCDFDLGILGTNAQEIKICSITSYANDPDGFTLELHGTDAGLTTGAIEYDKLLTTDDEMSATSPDEEWGWKIGNASGYTGVQTDTDNGLNDFDAETCDLPTAGVSPCWHTVNVSTNKETFIDESAPVTPANGTFDLSVGVVTDPYVSEGIYQDTLTITMTAN